jgi:hypothetical protein
MTYAYIRVSSSEQHLDRQVIAIREVCPDIPDMRIYSDKQSGKNFERAGYQLLKSVLMPGDEVIIKELDRLGRNKEGIKEELKWFKDNGVTIRPNTIRLYVNGAEQPVYRFPTAPGTYEVVVDFTSSRNGTYPMREYVGLYAYIGKDNAMVTERFSLEVVAEDTEVEAVTAEPTETTE